ncbi:HAD family phosphatase [Anaerolineales bacterium HSG24]|nr:HAD family phosphatase [Anaerolineales bacterium HSG24]
MPHKSKPKAIIFDVGGVLIRTRHRNGREKWAARFNLSPNEFENYVFNYESGKQAQLGQKSWIEHWQWLAEHFKLNETEIETMEQDFFAGDYLNEPLVAYIQCLKQAGYLLGILSNYSDQARSLWTGTYPFIHYFDGVIISAEVGIAKPTPKIYHLAAKSLGINIAEAVFIDDFIENIEGARAVGMSAIHFVETDAVIQKLTQLTGVSLTEKR